MRTDAQCYGSRIHAILGLSSGFLCWLSRNVTKGRDVGSDYTNGQDRVEIIAREEGWHKGHKIGMETGKDREFTYRCRRHGGGDGRFEFF